MSDAPKPLAFAVSLVMSRFAAHCANTKEGVVISEEPMASDNYFFTNAKIVPLSNVNKVSVLMFPLSHV